MRVEQSERESQPPESTAEDVQGSERSLKQQVGARAMVQSWALQMNSWQLAWVSNWQSRVATCERAAGLEVQV